MSMYTQIMFSRYFKNILKLQPDLDPELEKLSEHKAWVYQSECGASKESVKSATSQDS